MSTWLTNLNLLLGSPRRRKDRSRWMYALEGLEARVVLDGSPITVSPTVDITSNDGKVNAQVASFTDTNEAATAKDFKATIDWGDGSTSKGKIDTNQEGAFTVSGKHHYKSNGNFAVTVIVDDKSGNSASNGGYDVDKLVSDQAGQATNTDPNLVNAWGLALSPTGPFWINDAGTGVSTLIDGEGNVQSLVVTVPGPANSQGPSSPTGMVFNGTADFAVTGGASHFIFATEDGTISGWNTGTNAELKVDNSSSGAIYKGLANGSVGSANYIYATDFHNNKIDVFDGNFASAQLAGNFQVPKGLPKGYAPFGIENINGTLFVTYAKQDAAAEDDVAKEHSGYVAEFSTDGQFIKMFAAKGALNSPWGLAQAPSDFGQFANALLIGNFGDGTVNAYDPTTGDFLGTVSDTSGQPLTIDGLWALKFGNGAAGGDTDDVYFTAGPDDEAHGLFGEIDPQGEQTHVHVGEA